MRSETTDILTRLSIPEFIPQFPLRGGYAQTIAAYYWPQAETSQEHAQHLVNLEDGDRLVLIETVPEEVKSTTPIVVLVHGLAGSHLSSYMVRLSAKFMRLGYRVMRLNLRGCGPGAPYAAIPYHAGRSQDLLQALNYLNTQFNSAPMAVIAFSLGGNLALKMAGELRQHQLPQLAQVISVSAPIDLDASVRKIIMLKNWAFDQHFVRLLRRNVKELDQLHPQRPIVSLPASMNLYEFDDRYTAPVSGYGTAANYYRNASSSAVIADIKVPTLMVIAEDDPMVASESYLKLPSNKHVRLMMTASGGHQGFLAQKASAQDHRWMDAVLIKSMLAALP